MFPRHGAENYPVPDRITEQSLRDTVGQGWAITRLAQATYTTAVTREDAVRRLAPDEPAPDFSTLTTDERGRVVLPLWQLTALRA